MPRSRERVGKATFTAEMSRITMSWASDKRTRSVRREPIGETIRTSRNQTAVSELIIQTMMSDFNLGEDRAREERVTLVASVSVVLVSAYCLQRHTTSQRDSLLPGTPAVEAATRSPTHS
jgi:hypothetical protein